MHQLAVGLRRPAALHAAQVCHSRGSGGRFLTRDLRLCLIQVGVVTHNLRPKFPANCPEWYKSLAHKCWRKDPTARPSFGEVTRQLLAMLSDKDWRPDDA